MKAIASILVTSISCVLPAEPVEFEPVLPTEHQVKLVGMYMDVQDYFDKFEVKPQIDIHYSPKFDSSVVSGAVKSYYEASAFFGIKKTNIVYFNEKEEQWYQSKMSILEGRYDDYWLKHVCSMKSNDTCGMASQWSSYPHYYHMIGSNIKESSDWMKWVTHHETVHGFQKNFGLMSGQIRSSCWILEAQANALSFASFIENHEIDDLREDQVRRVYEVIPNIKNMKSNEFVTAVKNIESNRSLCFQKGFGYFVGMLIVEYMYINYDVEKVHQMMKSMASGVSFDSASRTYFKISQDELYEKSFDYVLESLREAS